MRAHIYEQTAWDHGFAPKLLQENARTDECYRCDTEPAGRIDALEPDPGLCRACLDEISHRNESRRYDDAIVEGFVSGRGIEWVRRINGGA